MTPSPSRRAVSTESARRAASGSGLSGPKALPSASRVAHHEAVDHDLDGVPLVLVQLDGASSRSISSPSTRTRTKPWRRAAANTRSPSVLRSLMSGPSTRMRLPSGSLPDAVGDLLHGHTRDLTAALGAVRMADAREEQPQVVVDLGHGADRGARVAAGALLVDGDGRGEAVDLVDVGLLHLAQELPRIGGQRLDVAALALGVDGVEGQAGLAAAGQAGDDDEPVARQLDVDVLEVVFAGAANDEMILGHEHQSESSPDV